MPQPDTILDKPAGESLRHGSQKVTFALAGELIAEEIEFSKSYNEFDRVDDFGIARHSAYSSAKGKGSMVIQVKTTEGIQIGDSGTFLTTDFAVIPFIVTRAGPVFSQAGAAKVSIDIAERTALSPLAQSFAGDGDAFVTALPCGPLRRSFPIQNDHTVILLKRKFCQYEISFSPLPLNDPGPVEQSILVEETELQDTGVSNVVTWDRVWVVLPIRNGNYAPRQEVVSVTKTRKKVYKQYTNNNLSGVSIASHSDLIHGIAEYSYHYQNIAIPGFPGVPDISLITLPNFTFVDNINGFPFNNTPGSEPDSNHFYHFLTGSIRIWMGRVYERVAIFGE